ncbi:hypothetical protein FSARC_9576 [Fusarium sarcochroum]|uniref:F-box domain-containing protein n=1 Tax=Fusarium sarcochroum TaxID=1208366 RepID=A0A8H4TQU3_9HYPO|nr:hypothetical protein FSARC_9576 [Fusarium sarcochroum]
MATQHEPPLSLVPRLMQLPYELINNIAGLLSRRDFESFRLSSQMIAECTRPQLALDRFDGMPWRQDGNRLHKLSLISSCARRIRSVGFNMARMDKEEVEYATSRIISAEELNRKWGSYLTTQDLFLESIELPLDLVIPALMRLPNLDTVSLTWTKCPWEEIDICNVFERERSLELAGDEILESQQAVLDALCKRNAPLKGLTIEPFMYPELTLPSKLDDKVSTVLGTVTKLHLVVDYEVDLFMPDRLDYFISLMPNIRDLRIHSWPVGDEASDIDFYITNRLSNLEKLDLSCLHFNFVNFARLIKDHGPTLKEVRMQTLYGWCDPFNSAELDWDMMFQLMREKLKAPEKIRINGTFSDNVGWHQLFFHGGTPWADELARIMGERSNRLEDFILKGGKYPQPTWSI